MPSRLATVIARLLDAASDQYDEGSYCEALAALIDAELRDDDDLMYALAAVVARTRRSNSPLIPRGYQPAPNESDERLVLDLLDCLAEEDTD